MYCNIIWLQDLTTQAPDPDWLKLKPRFLNLLSRMSPTDPGL